MPRPSTILGHGREFVHEHVNIGKRIPRIKRGLCKTKRWPHGLATALSVMMIRQRTSCWGRRALLRIKELGSSHERIPKRAGALSNLAADVETGSKMFA
jgi:hypothetical protein